MSKVPLYATVERIFCSGVHERSEPEIQAAEFRGLSSARPFPLSHKTSLSKGEVGQRRDAARDAMRGCGATSISWYTINNGSQPLLTLHPTPICWTGATTRTGKAPTVYGSRCRVQARMGVGCRV